jgi:hypothetical protein
MATRRSRSTKINGPITKGLILGDTAGLLRSRLQPYEFDKEEEDHQAAPDAPESISATLLTTGI